MLFIPPGREKLFLVGIDPGTTTLGVSVLSYDFNSGLKRLEMAYTLNAAKCLSEYSPITETSGERYARLKSHSHYLGRLFEELQPDEILTEVPYMGIFPQAFAGLVETLGMIENTVRQYNPFMQLQKIDPATVKTHVNVSGKSKDKMDMHRAVCAIPDIDFSRVNPTGLDEHSIDAIAVAYARLRLLTSRL
jgi:Holliday junction resolvasome RuvABC endonuclease subunit